MFNIQVYAGIVSLCLGVSFVITNMSGFSAEPINAVTAALFLGVSVVYLWSRKSQALGWLALLVGIPIVYLIYRIGIQAPESFSLMMVGIAALSGITSATVFPKFHPVLRLVGIVVVFTALCLCLGILPRNATDLAAFSVLMFWALCITGTGTDAAAKVLASSTKEYLE